MNSDYVVTVGERHFRVKVVGEHLVEIDGQRRQVDFVRLAEDHYSLLLDNAVFDLVSNPVSEDKKNSLRGARVRVSMNMRDYIVTVDDRRSLLLKSLRREEASESNSLVVMSPMPGMVVKVEVHEGDEVEKGDGLVILEAMKMENELKAPVRGRVISVHVRGGAAVEKGEQLVTIQTESH
jgi:pyruvate carboxylase subunit B